MPTLAQTASDVGDAIYEDLRSGLSEDRAWRHLISLNDDLAREPGDVRVALCASPPPPTGDRRFDAALAGMVKHHLGRDGLPLPSWLLDPKRSLDEPWIVDPLAANNIADLTPGAFRSHGVLVDRIELESV